MILIIPPLIPNVPFYSQFRDLHTTHSWQKVGCGVTSLAMVLNYYVPDVVTTDTLLKEGILIGAYDKKYGWIHKGLIQLSNTYGMTGESYDISSKKAEAAYTTLKSYLINGPVIVSVHYKFDPRSPIPHLVVLDGIDGDTLYYNDPAQSSGRMKISKVDFIKGWKKRFIVIRPVETTKKDSTV